MTIQTREQSESGKGAVRVRLRRFPRCMQACTSLGTTTRSDRQEVKIGRRDHGACCCWWWCCCCRD